MSGDSFYIMEKGRHKSEKSLILVERGSLVGFGFAPYHFQGLPQYKWKRFIELIDEDRDARTILSAYLRKNQETQIVRI